MCLINDYSLHIYIYINGRAECATISLECTKVKLLIFNNFDTIIGSVVDKFTALTF